MTNAKLTGGLLMKMISRRPFLLFCAIAALSLLPSSSPAQSSAGGPASQTETPLYVCGEKHPPENGPCATPPRVKYDPDPELPRGAKGRHAKVVLWLVVTQNGESSDIRVEQTAGQAYDEAAVTAVKRWRFAPGTYSDKPVPVIIHVEISFEPPVCGCTSLLLFRSPRSWCPAVEEHLAGLFHHHVIEIFHDEQVVALILDHYNSA